MFQVEGILLRAADELEALQEERRVVVEAYPLFALFLFCFVIFFCFLFFVFLMLS